MGRSAPASARCDFRLVFDPVLARRYVGPGAMNAFLLERCGRRTRVGVAPCPDFPGMRVVSILQSDGVGAANQRGP